MKTVSEPEALQATRGPVFLALGFFDGVHRGHQAVLRSALDRARACGGEAWALTFEPHPARVLRPAAPPLLLTPLEEKKQRIAALGMDGCVVMPFTQRLARTEPEAFLEHVRRGIPSLRGISVGIRASFGRDARGDARLLRHWGEAAGWEVCVIPPLQVDGVSVSSTRIRAAVAEGRLEEAARWLGHSFTRSGIVERGRGVGRGLGFPTLNIRVPTEALLPPAGIYAARVWTTPDTPWNAAAYYGARPTFPGLEETVLEAHLPDFHGDVYHQRVDIAFLRRIRGDRRFESVEALRAGIARDLDACRAVWST